MDKKKINEILDQLVVWEPQERVDDRMHIRDREQTKRQLFSLGYGEEEIDEALDEITHDSRMVVNGINITIPKKIKSIKHQPKLCELNCGQMLINQKIERSYHSWPEPHWRTKCTNCQHYLHPEGDRLVKGVHEFKSYYQRKKR